MYRNAGSAGKSHRAISKKRRWQNSSGSFGAAGPTVSLVTGSEVKSAVEWPVYVTTRGTEPGTITTHVMLSRKHADQLGFTWADRPTGASKA